VLFIPRSFFPEQLEEEHEGEHGVLSGAPISLKLDRVFVLIFSALFPSSFPPFTPLVHNSARESGECRKLSSGVQDSALVASACLCILCCEIAAD